MRQDNITVLVLHVSSDADGATGTSADGKLAWWPFPSKL
jgi:hypothetical protein